MNKTNLSKTLLIIICSLFCAFLFRTGDTYAAFVSTDDQLYKAALLSGLEQCYGWGIKDPIKVSQFKGTIESVINNSQKTFVPTKIGSDSKGSMTCKQLAKAVGQTIGEANTLEKAGYQKKVEAIDPTTQITFNAVTGNTSRLKIQADGAIEITNAGTDKATCVKGSTMKIYTTIDGKRQDIGHAICSGTKISFYYANNSVINDTYNNYNVSIKNKDANAIIGSGTISGNGITPGINKLIQSFSTSSHTTPFRTDNNVAPSFTTKTITNSSDSTADTYVPVTIGSTSATDLITWKDPLSASLITGGNGSSKSNVGQRVIHNLGIKTDPALGCKENASTKTTSCKYSAAMTYALYYRYVQENDSLKIQECGAEKKADAKYTIKNKDNQWCTIAVSDDRVLNDKYTIVESSGRLTQGTLETVLKWLSTDSVYGYVGAAAYADSTVGSDGTIGKTQNLEEAQDACYSGAGILGWIVCPLVDTSAGLINNIYNTIENDYLKIDADSIFNTKVKSTGGSTVDITHQAWNIVRNIANIIFAIFILIIIFSQLTGAGIDNYGIKRTLPRLIIAAILVNASWIICRFAVDLSNVVGVGISGIINPGNITIVEDPNMLTSTGSKVIEKLVTFGTASSIGIATLMINPGAILTLLLGLLTVAVAVIFFWLILIAREVAVILLIILAPLAFVCYLLPNTENLFKRWIKIAEAMLVLYPLCSLVVSGGRLVGSILAVQANNAMDITASIIAPIFGDSTLFSKAHGLRLAAMIVQVAPYFFIPVLLKNSLAGIGNLGAKLSNMGSKFGRSASNSIKNTEGFKNTQARSLERRTRLKAGLDKDGNAKDSLRNKFIDKTGIGARSRSRYRSQYLKDTNESNRNELLSSPEYMKAAIAAQESAMNKEKLDAEMANMKTDTGNFSPALMQQQLEEHLSGKHGALTDANGNITAAGLRTRALMKKMSTSGGFNQKNMTEVFNRAGTTSGGVTYAAFSKDNMTFAAKFMQSDSDVSSAMTRNMNVAQYLRDVNDEAAGITFTDSATGATQNISGMTVDSWQNASMNVNGANRGSQNGKFVIDKVVDKNEDFLKQSDGAIRSAIKKGFITDSRLEGIYNNDILFRSASESARKDICTQLNSSAAAAGRPTTFNPNK